MMKENSRDLVPSALRRLYTRIARRIADGSFQRKMYGPIFNGRPHVSLIELRVGYGGEMQLPCEFSPTWNSISTSALRLSSLRRSPWFGCLPWSISELVPFTLRSYAQVPVPVPVPVLDYTAWRHLPDRGIFAHFASLHCLYAMGPRATRSLCLSSDNGILRITSTQIHRIL